MGVVARTEDAGRTWQVTGAPTGFRNDVAWIADRRAVAVGNPGSHLTTDGEATWTRFDDAVLFGVSYSPGAACWAVGQDAMAARTVLHD